MNLRNILNSLKSRKLKRTVFFSLVFVIPHGIAQTNIIDEAPKKIDLFVLSKTGLPKQKG